VYSHYNNQNGYDEHNEENEIELPGSVSPPPQSRPTTAGGNGSRTLRASRAAEQLAAKRKERSMGGMVVANDSISRPGTATGSRPSTPSASSPMMSDVRKSVLSQQTVPHVNNYNTNSTTTFGGESVNVSISAEPVGDGHHYNHMNNQQQPKVLTDAERELLKRGISPSFDPMADKPLVKSPHVDFTDIRSFMMRPPPKGGMVQCRVHREASGMDRLYPHYNLILEEGNSFLLAARKRKKSKSSNYLISLDKNDLSRDGNNFMGKLRSNFVGTEFVMYDKGVSPSTDGTTAADTNLRQELGVILYGSNILGFKGPRKMSVIIPALKDDTTRVTWRPQSANDTLLERYKTHNHSNMVVLQNKSPVWSEESQSYVLNFHNRVKQASVKNFQLVHPDDPEYIIMQFGRVSEDVFTMDFQYPLCMLQAFSIVLSSFDSKIACE